MNKLKLVLILILFPTLASCRIQSNVKKNRELLREYFLYVCIEEGFKNLGIEEYDISASIYFQISGYAPKAYEEIRSYAKEFINTIQPSILRDHDNKKPLIIRSLDKYNSKDLKKKIKSMDRYLYYKKKNRLRES